MSALRQAIDNMRYERFGLRIGGPDATIEGYWVALIVSMIVVFACFFAIGRAMHPGGPSPGEAPSTRQAASGRPAIPAALEGGPPTEGAIPIAIATAAARHLREHPKPRSIPAASALGASAPTRSFSESHESPTTTSQSESSGTGRSTPAVAAPPSRTVEPRSSSPAPAKSEAHPPSGSSSGGGSFDTSE
jgi:hypothetical protein